MNRRSSRGTVRFLLAFLLCGSALSAQVPNAQAGFPGYEEIEYEHSIITIPIILEGETEPAEVVKFDAYMKLDREKPVRNGLGYRQFEFIIDAWELYGYSKVLNANITFKLSNTVKPKSLGVALQKDKDYPAMIVYNAIYDIYLNDVKIGENQAGVAFATGVMEIPPRNITVAFHKPFAFNLDRSKKSPGTARKNTVCITDPCPCEGDFCYGSGTCEDMESISASQFEAGATKAKVYRSGRSGPGESRRERESGSASRKNPQSPKKEIKQ
jgi:hypothetical protein